MRPPFLRRLIAGTTPPNVIALSAVICLSCMGFAVHLGLAARSAATTGTLREMAEISDGIARRIESDLALFDLALREAANPAHGPARPAPLEHPVIASHAAFINILNETGGVIADSRSGIPKPANFAGRDYFQDQMKNPAGTLAIGRPFATAPNQHASIPISRRLSGPDGAFAGVVVAGIRLAWLREVLSHPSPGLALSITIRRADGLILMRTPFDPDDIGRGGATDPDWQTWSRTGTSPATGDHGDIRLFRRLNAAPLVLDLAMPRAVTGEWLWFPALPLIPCLAVLGLSLLANRLTRHGNRIAAASRAANDDRMRLLATMSHELRTPLTGILGQAELLREEGALNGRQATRLARLTEAGTLMRHVVNRVLDLAQPEAHEARPLVAPSDLDALIVTCRGMVESEARAKGLHLISYVTTVRSFPNEPFRSV
ncbi:MAG: hypothetical protein EXR07_21455 [Acetobacteraceae bacterium]|nr:hypothetical protein [Acetobacteraceae bacterium]